MNFHEFRKFHAVLDFSGFHDFRRIFCLIVTHLFSDNSTMESHRGFRLIFHARIQLPSEAWLQCDDGPLHIGLGDFRICGVFRDVHSILRGLCSA